MAFVLITAILMTITPTNLLQQIAIEMDNTITTTMTMAMSFKYETQTREFPHRYYYRCYSIVTPDERYRST